MVAFTSDGSNEPLYDGTFGPPRSARRGSVYYRYAKCGKPGCPCADDKEARHGPYASLARVVDGRTKTSHLSVDEAKLVERQVAEGGQLVAAFKSYLEECERRADQELEAMRLKKAEEAKKGGSKRRSRRVLRPRSKV